MFNSNTTGLYSPKIGFDAFGEQLFGPSIVLNCAIVSLTDAKQKTPIRTDSSASRGNADEDVIKAKILFTTAVEPFIGDLFVVQNLRLRFQSVQPRLNIFGILDHYECNFEALPNAG